MGDAGLVWRRKGKGKDDLYEQIGLFLADHRLSPEPLHYAFVHAVLSAPDSPLAREVRELVDGGVRLTHQEVERLGGRVVMGADPGRRLRDPAPVPNREADRLVTETVAKMDGFAMLVRAMHFETRDFGRDLAESAAAIEMQRSTSAVDELSRLAGAIRAKTPSPFRTNWPLTSISSRAIRAPLNWTMLLYRSISSTVPFSRAGS